MNRLTEAPFSTRDAYGYVGASMDWKRHRFTVAGTAEHFSLDYDTLRRTYGGFGQWSYDIDDRSRFDLTVQGTNLEYINIPTRDVDRYVFSAGYVRALRYATEPIIFVNLYGGMENENNNSFPQFGHDLGGVRIGASSQLPSIHRKVRGFFSMNVEHREYHGPDGFFLKDRNDTQIIASFGLECEVFGDWRVIPEVSIITNGSNIPLNEYDRVTGGVRVRYSF